MQAGPFWEKISEKKCLAVPKTIERGHPLVLPGMVCYAEKQGKPFWSSSLGQMVQFDTIIFCRTFKNLFCQFVWIEKKVTLIVAFHFMKHRLKKSHYNSRVSLHEAPTKNCSQYNLLKFFIIRFLTIEKMFSMLGKNR